MHANPQKQIFTEQRVGLCEFKPNWNAGFNVKHEVKWNINENFIVGKEYSYELKLIFRGGYLFIVCGCKVLLMHLENRTIMHCFPSLDRMAVDIWHSFFRFIFIAVPFQRNKQKSTNVWYCSLWKSPCNKGIRKRIPKSQQVNNGIFPLLSV